MGSTASKGIVCIYLHLDSCMCAHGSHLCLTVSSGTAYLSFPSFFPPPAPSSSLSSLVQTHPATSIIVSHLYSDKLILCTFESRLSAPSHPIDLSSDKRGEKSFF